MECTKLLDSDWFHRVQLILVKLKIKLFENYKKIQWNVFCCC